MVQHVTAACLTPHPTPLPPSSLLRWCGGGFCFRKECFKYYVYSYCMSIHHTHSVNAGWTDWTQSTRPLQNLQPESFCPVWTRLVKESGMRGPECTADCNKLSQQLEILAKSNPSWVSWSKSRRTSVELRETQTCSTCDACISIFLKLHGQQVWTEPIKSCCSTFLFFSALLVSEVTSPHLCSSCDWRRHGPPDCVEMNISCSLVPGSLDDINGAWPSHAFVHMVFL